MTPHRAATGVTGRAATAAAIAAVLVATAACGAGAGSAGDAGGAGVGGVAAGGKPVRAVAAVKPLAALVEPVLGERGTVTALVPPGAGHHAYAPSPGDVARLERADVYFGNGLGLNPDAARLARANLPAGAPLVALAEAAVDPDDLIRGHTHTHGDGTRHRHAGGANPHTWLSVPLAMASVEHIAEVLARLDPDGAGAYRANAAAYRDRLAALHRSIQRAAATVPPDKRTIVTFHAAHRYFAREYGFELVGATAPSDFSAPSAGEIADIIDHVEAHDVPAVFGSALVPEPITQAIVAETGAVDGGGLSDEVLPGEPGQARHSYIGLMARNARTVVGALGGDAGLVAGP